MDITKLFKATLKTVRLRRKDLEKNSEDSPVIPGKQHRNTNHFQMSSVKVCQSISKLKTFLAEHRKDYIGEFSSVLGDINGMTDDERDQIDKDAQLFVRTCSNSINVLKNEVSCDGAASQLTSHRKSVVHLLENYLKDICKLYSQQKAIRVKMAVDRKKMSRLSPRQSDDEKRSREDVIKQIKEDKRYKSNNESVNDNILSNNPGPTEIATFSKEEIQMFEKENDALLNELNNITDEVKQIEGKVVEISRLQEIFSEKILDQANVIEKAHETAVTTTENIKDGNENIREAIKNSASFRVWILFFLVMCTFSLLFLDWYNQ